MKRRKELKNKTSAKRKNIVAKRRKPPIKHWSHSSLVAYLRNPLAWYKRYVEEIYDTPTTPAAVVGSAGHKALENFYNGVEKELAIQKGLEYVRSVGDFEINFGRAKTRRAKKGETKENGARISTGHFILSRAAAAA